MTQATAPAAQDDNSPVDMKDLVSLCKRRGFIFPASEIYGGINGFWDYGPLGVELKNNIRDLWWKAMVITPPVGPDGMPVQIVGVDSAIIQNPKAWVASGHVGGFSDPMVDCRETKRRYRADHLNVLKPKDGEGPWLAAPQDDEDNVAERRVKKFGKGKSIGAYEIVELPDVPVADYKFIIGPDATEAGTLTEPKDFNLMFETYVGATQSEDSKAYLRPETAQGIFLNYKNVLDTARVRVPFGIAQIGKAYRNEVNPRNFVFRSREFEQMEMEWFCPPEDAGMWRDFWVTERKKWWESIGIRGDAMILREHGKDELSHYAKAGVGTVDIEYQFPFTYPGFGELEGIAHRCDYDLTQHQAHSGTKMEYIDPDDNTKRYLPHVIEPAAGLTRGVLTVLCEAYTVDPSRPSGMYLNFKPSVAPKKAAILPLVAKDGMPELATKLYMELREEMPVDLDIKQNIGKRYARQDEIGTPYCITIDGESLTDQTVTIRERNTMAQERIALDKVKAYLKEKLSA
ncbi:MAG: glycine--tRNA ligase [Pseudobdellovibrionaceae bacterium]